MRAPSTHPPLLLPDQEFVVARDEELSSASLIPAKIHVLVVRFKVPAGADGDSGSAGGANGESAAKEGEQMQQVSFFFFFKILKIRILKINQILVPKKKNKRKGSKRESGTTSSARRDVENTGTDTNCD